MRTRSAAAVFALSTLFTLVAPTASAEPADDDARIAFLKDTLARDAAASRLWFLGWASVYALSTSAESIISVSASDPGIRADTRVDAVKSAIGFISVVVLPPPSLRAPAFLPPHPTDAEKEAFIAAEERRLDDAAEAERFGKSWLAHVGCAAVNVGGGLFLWLHDDRLPSAIVATVVGIAAGEIEIATMPTVARDARRDYKPKSLSLAPLLDPRLARPSGLSMQLAF